MVNPAEPILPKYSDADAQTLREAIASGVKVVQYSDRRVEYRSLAEMREILGIIEAVVEAPISGFGRTFRKYFRLDSDLR